MKLSADKKSLAPLSNKELAAAYAGMSAEELANDHALGKASLAAQKKPQKGRATAKRPKVKLVRRGGFTFLQSDRPITSADVARGMKDFP